MRKILGLILALTSTLVFAQSWPQRPVKFVCPLGPGSGADITGRLLADRLGERWGEPVVFENRPGGEGVIAINAVIAANDDHTLLYGPSSSFVGHPYQLEKIPYDPRELQPVARVSSTVVVIAVPTSLNVNSLKDLMAMVRAQPGKMNWSSITGVTDLVIAGYLKGAGLDAVRVPYKNPVAGLTDLVEGRLHFYSSAYAIVRPQVQAGKVKALAIQNRGRVPGLEFPTVAEAGLPRAQLRRPGRADRRALERRAGRGARAHCRRREGGAVRSGDPRAHDADRADRRARHAGGARRRDRGAGRPASPSSPPRSASSRSE